MVHLELRERAWLRQQAEALGNSLDLEEALWAPEAGGEGGELVGKVVGEWTFSCFFLCFVEWFQIFLFYVFLCIFV